MARAENKHWNLPERVEIFVYASSRGPAPLRPNLPLQDIIGGVLEVCLDRLAAGESTKGADASFVCSDLWVAGVAVYGNSCP